MIRADLSSRLSWITLCSTLVLAGLTLRTPQSLYSDPAYQVDALQEYLQGHSHSFNETIKPMASDLSKDESNWIIWWPPGTQLAAYPWMAHGFSIGATLRIITLLMIAIGAMGWVRWMALFDLPEGLLIALAILLPWMRYVSNSLFMYSAEILVFGTAPWILLSTHAYAEAWQGRRLSWGALWACGGLLGIALGMRYVLKYSGVFLSMGALLFLAGEMAKDRQHRPFLGVLSLIALGCALPVIILNVLNHHFGHVANGLIATAGLHFHWNALGAAIGDPALAVADADGLCRFLFLHPGHYRMTSDAALWWIGLPGGLLLLGLLMRSKASTPAERLTRLAVLTTQLCVWIVWSFSLVADFAARHLASAAIMALPFCLQEGIRLWRAPSPRAVRAGLVLAGAVYIAVPLVYGVVSVAAKVRRTPAHYGLDNHRLYLPLLAKRDLRGVRERLLAEFDLDHDIFYLPDPLTAIALPGRTIVRQADFLSIQQLQGDHFVTSRPLRILALIPPEFEKNGKAAVIRHSFPQAELWTHHEIPGCNYVLWIAVLNATTDHR
jgi:hypothetical protein